MCVYKNHAFICFGRPPSWSETVLIWLSKNGPRQFSSLACLLSGAHCKPREAVPAAQMFIFVLPVDRPTVYMRLKWRVGVLKFGGWTESTQSPKKNICEAKKCTGFTV
jgi:hypothetical protein